MREYRKDGNSQTVYFFDSQTISALVNDDTAYLDVLVHPDGTWFDDTGWTLVGAGTENKAFLYQYNATSPEATTLDVKTDCAVISTWTSSGAPAGPNAPQHCFYPMAVKAASGDPGNVPLTTSCLASFGYA
jgi:hypothetical protein